MKILGLISTLTLALLFNFQGQAALPKKAMTMKKPQNVLRDSGSVRGGQAGLGFSLLDLRKTASAKSKIERLVIDVGDRAYQKQTGSVGYFNVELRNGGKQVVVDFAQVLNAKFSEGDLKKKLASSNYIKSSEMIFESEGQTTSLVLNLKQKAQVRVQPVNGKGKQTARLVLDLMGSK